MYSYPKSAKDIMDAQKSRLNRQDGEIAALQLDVEFLERDVADRTAERDQARAIAVDLEQQLARIVESINNLYRIYRDQIDADPTLYNGGALDAVGIVRHLIAGVTEAEE